MSPGSVSRVDHLDSVTPDSELLPPDEAARVLRTELRRNQHHCNPILVAPVGKPAYLIISDDLSDLTFFHEAKTPEAAADVFVRCIPPECKTTVIIVADYDKADLRCRSVQALHDAGFRNIETVDDRCMNLHAIINSLTLNCVLGDSVFVNFSQEITGNFAQCPLFVIKKCKDGWQLIDVLPTSTIALSKYPSTRHVVIHKNATESIQQEVKELFPDQHLHLSEAAPFYDVSFVKKRAHHANLKGSGVFPACYVDLFVQFGDKRETISLNKRVTPFTFTKEIDVGNASDVTVRAFSHGKFRSTTMDKTLTFKKPAFRKVSITVNVNENYALEVNLRTASTYKPTVQPIETSNKLDAAPIKLDPPPKNVLTFTSDNRVLIEADETYTGDKEILAYVRLRSGKAPEVGQKAFDALKNHPGSVFYDVTRLLAADFGPNHSDPSWRFKTIRDAEGELIIHGEDGIKTFPIALFGIVVMSILKYIKEHTTSEVGALGIRLPSGSVISDTELKSVSDRIGVELKLL